jgi:integrase
MSDIRKLREKYIGSNELDNLYINHTSKFVEYVEQIGKGDRIIYIDENDIRDSVTKQNELGHINTITSMDNHLNAIKNFFVYLQKEGKYKNVFNDISDYDKFRELIIVDLKLDNVKPRGYLTKHVVIDLLKYFEDNPNENILINFYIRLNLLAPTKRKNIVSLKFKDFDTDFRWFIINGVEIKLTQSLSKDIKSALNNKYKEKRIGYKNNDYLFSFLSNSLDKSKKFNAETLNRLMYLILKEIGYDLPQMKLGHESYSLDVIMNTGILELAQCSTNPFLISKVSGLNLTTIDKKIKQLNDSEYKMKDIDKIINSYISQSDFHQYI